ncbi:MAG: hypothetical protein VX104_04225 [Planctomycetota bacterium]|nr:hypothetical protein [Planctomycetota bacterium]
MNWRITGYLLGLAVASMVWSSWTRPLDLLPSPDLNLESYSQIEVIGDAGWSMSKDGDWCTSRPRRARLSNTRVEQWIRHFDRLESCLPPEDAPAHSIRFSKSLSGGSLDVPVWFDVVGPAKIQFDGRWYSVSSEVAEPIRFGLAPFRTLQVVAPSFSPTAIRIKLGDRVSLELLKTPSWSIREPLEAPADPGAVQAWLEAVESKTASAILGEVPATQEELLSGLFPVAAELSLVGTETIPTRSIRFGKRLADGSRLAQVRGEDTVFVVSAEDTAFMLPTPTRFLFSTCTTVLPERIHTIAVGDKAVRRNALTGQFDAVGTLLLDLLSSTPASNFAMSSSLPDGVPFQSFGQSGEALFTGQIQLEGSQLAVWSDGLARIMPADDGLISWLQSAVGTTDRPQSSLSTPEGEG